MLTVMLVTLYKTTRWCRWLPTDSRRKLIHYREREAQPEEDTSVPARIERLESQFKESGIRRSVEALLIVSVRLFPPPQFAL